MKPDLVNLAKEIIWVPKTNKASWCTRDSMGAVVYDDRMWLMGGFDVTDFAHNNEVWFSSDGANWLQATKSASWSPRAMHSSVVFDHKMWVIGGGVYNPNHDFNTAIDYSDVWYSADGANWHQATEAAAWPARRFHCSVIYDGKIWVVAGYAKGNRNDVWHSSNGVNWEQATSETIWATRHEPSCLVHDNSLQDLTAAIRGDPQPHSY